MDKWKLYRWVAPEQLTRPDVLCEYNKQDNLLLINSWAWERLQDWQQEEVYKSERTMLIEKL